MLDDDQLTPFSQLMPGVRPMIAPPTQAAPALTLPGVMPQMPPMQAQASAQPMQPSQTVKDQNSLQSLRASGSGISQIQNPFLHGLAKTADVIGSIAAPRIAAQIPGTTMHHNALVNQQQGIIANDQTQDINTAKIGQESALATQEQAKAAALNNPPEKQGDPTKTVQTDDGVFQFNPDTGKYDQRVGDQKTKPDSYVIHESDQGIFRVNTRTGEATPLTVNGQPLTPKTKEGSKDDRAIQIQGKDPKTWTPEEQSFMRGYRAYVKENKVDPGVMRAQIFMDGRPVQTTDDQGNVHYEHAGQAIKEGANAPGSIGFQAQKAVTRDFTSGKDAQTLNAINTAHEHLAQLSKLSDALGNGDIQLVNKIAQEYATQTGSAAPTNFEAVKAAVAGEVSKTFKGGGATDAEIATMNQNFGKAQSPAQLKGAIQQTSQLMESKRNALQQQYTQGMQGQPNFNPAGGAETRTYQGHTYIKGADGWHLQQ